MQALQQKQQREQELKDLLAAIKVKSIEERVEHCNYYYSLLLLLLLLLLY